LKFKFLTPRTILLPTLFGWGCLFIAALLISGVWVLKGEAFLCITDRMPARVLVVDGWISVQGIRAAKDEFTQGKYEYIVTTGGLTGNSWDAKRWSHAVESRKMLLHWGVSPERIILAELKHTEAQRTFESVIAVRDALIAKGVRTDALNVFTRGAHARRSRLTYAKVFEPETKIGVIAWSPPGYDHKHWWDSSERTVELLKETAAYLYELILNSGRFTNQP
jgi:hypothetical protein